ncbi:4-(cytidine 5'-diphospho)-2-C-methyl-D-erythritol kinase [Natronospirillum operosum]|uniref:4-diphosphocytidyl-2-C-methyl-D-erythritol kinase n=1 Tax=Natronospirillum operosum TaxID=2759953 RepID=A0A4Z0WJE0_9GAMM|nr:4-(cytidine 5'-diphospho)-2-C-methyl-D-erythritol kinase [Natronospirillum operosum]TGG95927.1 4-(cytidine 5'-diphospho)-2-C-methyl-D-erythritol kinase [Natronospirillum operosum]
MSHSLTLPAPAKLNLMLHITGRRADGYHELQTLFQLLDYGDRLHFELAEDRARGPHIELADSAGIPGPDNLINRAAASLQPHARLPVAVRVRLDKVLPVGGGLGGGSSDCATTLLALNEFWHCGLSRSDLVRLGTTLGADVPLFVRGHSAWAEGIGERLHPVDLPARWFVVCQPDSAVSTRAVFTDPGLTRNSQITTIRTALEGGGRNDCEPVVRRRYPEINTMLDTLSAYGPARLTGTGACAYTVFEQEGAARSAAADLAAQYRTFVAPGINRSPVIDLLPTLSDLTAPYIS